MKAKKFSSFEEQVQKALDIGADSMRLGSELLLSAPIFFRVDAEYHQTAAAERGRLLWQRLRQSADLLYGSSPPRSQTVLMDNAMSDVRDGEFGHHYAYALLDAAYFNQFLKPAQKKLIWSTNERTGLFPISKSTYFRHIKQAVRELTAIFGELHRPHLALEQPRPHTNLIGRQTMIDKAIRHLQKGEVVGIDGTQGVGKTSIATAIAHQWPSNTVCWITMRAGFNDNLYALLFEIAHFLHQNGASGSWQYLFGRAEKTVDTNIVSGLLRYDFSTFEEEKLLLCIDNVQDILPQNGTGQQAERYIHLLTFLDGLRGVVPLLLTGEQAILHTPYQYTLHGLTQEQVVELLDTHHLTISATEVEALQRYTQGVPRLLHLCIVLREMVATWDELLTMLPSHSSVDLVFQKIWERLTSEERLMLMRLSPFRHPIGIDALDVNAETSISLINRGLFITHADNTVELLAYVRDGVYGRLSTEQRETLHQWAAAIRLGMRQYTYSMWHFVQAGDPERAIDLWLQHKKHELQQGHAMTALDLFNQVSSRRLPKASQEKLMLIRVRLQLLFGEHDDVLNNLRLFSWSNDTEWSVEAGVLHAQIEGMIGEPKKSDAIDQHTMAMAIRMSGLMLELHHNRAIRLKQQGDLTKVTHEALFARCKFERIQGLVQMSFKNYGMAKHHFQTALTLSGEAKHVEMQALVHMDMAINASEQQLSEDAITHQLQAIKLFKQVKDHVNVALSRLNLGVIYIRTDQPQKAIEESLEALQLYERINSPFHIALLSTNLAFAYLDLGEDDEAEEWASRAMRLEQQNIIPYVLHVLGKIEDHRGNYEKAEWYFEQSITAATENEDTYCLAKVWFDKGKSHIKRQNHEEAKNALEQAKILFTRLEIDSKVEEVEKSIATLQTQGVIQTV